MSARATLSALALVAAGCAGARTSRTERETGSSEAVPALSGAPAFVAGTVLDGSTGRPVGGARVTGPGGREAVSDACGRFELALVAGLAGPLLAREGARSGENRLRPLEPGRLEVVIVLRP